MTHNSLYPSPQNLFRAISDLQLTVSLISSWMSSKYLTLNPSKTEFQLIGILQQISKIINPSVSVTTAQPILPTPSAKKSRLHLWLHSLSFSKLISFVSSSFHLHIRDLRRIRYTIDFNTAYNIATFLVQSRSYYFNHCITHFPPPTQTPPANPNALFRAITRTSKHSHITPVLKSLHYLKIEQGIILQNHISITHNLFHKSEPNHLRNLINIKSTGKTRFSDNLSFTSIPYLQASNLSSFLQ